MDATAKVKAEIKTWERDFRSENGRNATVEDIKALPHIAEKYKLYKKLTKDPDGQSARGQQAPEPPKTPPRARSKQLNAAAAPAPILPKSRPVSSSTDAPTSNPFSPAKRKAVNAVASSSGVSTSVNPFLTPIKAKRESSRDSSPPFTLAPPPAAAVSKARKRLHGEPVSPSPQREKRRRVHELDSSSGERMSRSRSPSSSGIEGDSFVDDSPVKVPASGKAFEPLFEEASTASFSQPIRREADTGNKVKIFARAKTLPNGLFANVKKGRNEKQTSLNGDVFGGDSIVETGGTTSEWKQKDKGQGPSVESALRSKKKRILPGPRGLIPSKDDLFEANLPAAAVYPPSAPSHNANTSRKRSLSESTKDEKDMHATSNAWDLLPPSPPAADGSHWNINKGKGKTKARNVGKGRSKKVKLPGGSDEEMKEEHSSSESMEVKTVAWRGRAQSPQPTDAEDTALELNPELQFNRHGPQAHVSPQTIPSLEKFEVSLPEEIRRVLALSPGDQGREKEEEELVKGLIQGLRKGGAEVWGPGEIGLEGEASDGDPVIGDDWESEGVPWELAEL